MAGLGALALVAALVGVAALVLASGGRGATEPVAASSGTSCPVTRGTVRNRFLSSSVPGRNGVLVARRDPDGTLFQKLWWVPRKGFTGTLSVRGVRLDRPGRMRVLGVNWGYDSFGRGSWASAVAFPAAGCWRVTGRVGRIALSFVVRVVAG
jgi:hypothetical protein